MDFDDYSQPLEAVVREERGKLRPVPLRAQDQVELFEEWVRLNPEAMREMELTALAIDARGVRVSTKYLIEKLRYEGASRLTPVTFYDCQGNKHTYSTCNAFTPIMARWLLARHPGMRVVTARSMFDGMEIGKEEK